MDKEMVATLYKRGRSTHQIARAIGSSSMVVWGVLRDAGVRIRTRGEALRMKRRARVDTQGYVTWGRQRVHRIVCEAWHGPPPTPAHEVNHIDADKTNNHPENLEWVTRAGNVRHARRLGLMVDPPLVFGARHANAKLNNSKVCEMRRRHRNGETCTKIAQDYGVSVPAAHSAIIGKTWRRVTDEPPVVPRKYRFPCKTTVTVKGDR